MKYKKIPSPVGMLTLVADNNTLASILWENEKANRVRLGLLEENTQDHPFLSQVERQLNEYFAGKRKAFDLPMTFHGTSFQKKVWELLCQIPFGSTCSYKDIAEKLGNPRGVRAVGGAVGRNPISIIVPCHRVIGSNGTLTGFAGGLNRKQFLLDLEIP